MSYFDHRTYPSHVRGDRSLTVASPIGAARVSKRFFHTLVNL